MEFAPEIADRSGRGRTFQIPHSKFLIPLSLLFFLSGASALVYQVLWFRVFGWAFGVTAYAASTVWASFMAGLALGSWIAGRACDRVRHPLRWFAAAELLVAITAVASPALLSALQQAYVAAWPHLPHALPLVTLFRVAMAFAVLIVPTTMMGATLPLVIKSSAFRGRALGERVGVLYGSNTAGAILGTLAAGLALIPRLGIHRTFLAAAAINVTVAGTAILLSRGTTPEETERGGGPSVGTDRAMSDAFAYPPATLTVVLGVFTVSGAVSLALEVVWFRVLTLFLRPTVYGFAVMLATILAGLALGSYVVAPLLDRRRRWVALLAVAEFALAVAVVSSLRPLVALQAFSGWLTPILGRVAPPWLGYPVAGSVLALLPPALLMGLAFPIGLRVWTGGASDAGRTEAQRVARFYSCNVSGAIAGSLLGGFVLLPLSGSRASLIGLAAVVFASALVLLFVSEWPRPHRWTAAAIGTIAFAAAVAWSPDPLAEYVRQRAPGEQMLWHEEGIDSTVAVLASRRGVRTMTVNGNHQAGTDGSTAYVHRRIGHLPMALHPRPRRALVVGLGGGATAGAVSVHNADVDVIELAGSVVRGARFFDAINYGVLSRPNVHLQVDDGRNYMMLTRQRYDVVTADVIHPIYAGSGNLYSAEYFALMRGVLAPGGLAVQWVAGTEEEYRMIARTFLSVFPETTAWAGGSLLIGSTQPLRLRRSDFERKLREAGAAEGLRDLGVASFDQLRGLFTAGPDELRAFVGPGALLTDDKPLVEYFLSLPRDRDVDTSSMKGDVNRFVEPD